MKASEILMRRNAADLGKIKELFQKYSYKEHGKNSPEEAEEVNSDSTVAAQNKSDEEKPNDVPHLSACAEKPPIPEDPLRNPKLSDFGLSQYAFSRLWSAVKEQHTANAHQENSRNRTPLKPQASCNLPKTPRCKLKMDDYECVTPRIEHFGINEHTMCMNEDYTISLIRKTAQASEKSVKKDYHEVQVPVMASRAVMVTPQPKVTVQNAADWMTSPMVLVFCTPDVKTPSRTNSTALSRSPEADKWQLPSHAGTPRFAEFETRWLKPEAKVQGEKTESVTKSGAMDKQYTRGSIPFAVSSDEYLKHLGDPSPPKINHYEQLLSTPPPPEITRIPHDVLQILSKYNHKAGSSKAKETETKAGNTTRYESDFTDYCNKENRYD
ncbi:PREDICTED: spindle and kinetochore-associated protein 3 [Mesitornis unicolor]|uniref:spindle and kinetochore-associated protein 3 n=1 Tax=Mesitornis unicolor TaxID=54374 RepID=UPI0005290F31|nr:PREDICTED: spindle and kinetochore-associated protein 3 [Mesitornis unicolor]